MMRALKDLLYFYLSSNKHHRTESSCTILKTRAQIISEGRGIYIRAHMSNKRANN